jgi:hypothetical protein
MVLKKNCGWCALKKEREEDVLWLVLEGKKK